MVAGDHFKLRTSDAPPGIGQYTIGNESVVEDIVILETFRPFPLKIKGSLSD
jgi:hypothetical protein